MLDHLQKTLPQYQRGRLPKALRRFRRSIQIIDSTTIELVANSMDWAKHRRRKAAAKTHMRLDMESLLPRFAIVDTAKHNDARCAWELCAGLKDGEIVIFDRAYNDWKHLSEQAIMRAVPSRWVNFWLADEGLLTKTSADRTGGFIPSREW